MVTDDNYELALGALRAKFENDVEVKRCLNKKLYALAPKSERLTDQKSFLSELKATISQLSEINSAPDATVISANVLPKFADSVKQKVVDKLSENPDLEKDLESLMKQLSLAMDSAERWEEVKTKRPNVGENKEIKHVNSVNKQLAAPAVQSNNKAKSCLFCDRPGHTTNRCDEVTNIQQRIAILRKKNRCTRCLRQDHLSQDCRAHSICWKCNGDHHGSVCMESTTQQTTGQTGAKSQAQGTTNNRQGKKSKAKIKPRTPNARSQAANTVQMADAEAKLPETVVTNNVVTNGPVKTLLPIAQGRSYDPTLDKMRDVHILLDTGSDTTFITKALAKQLWLKPIGQETRSLKPFNAEPETRTYNIYQVVLFDLEGMPHMIEAYECDSVTGKVYNISLTEADKQFLSASNIRISVSESYVSTIPQMLVGSDVYGKFVSTHEAGISLPQGVALMKTKFGFVPYGPALIKGVDFADQSTVKAIQGFAIATQEIPEFVPDKQEFTGPTSEEKKQISEQVWKELKETIKRLEQPDGTVRYAVRLPWIPTLERLPTNRAIAKKRLDNLYRTSLAIPGRLEAIDEYFREQIKLGILEEVDERSTASGSRIHYLPNMPVLRPDSRTHPLRMVMDAAAHYTNEPCLNDLLYPGPLLLPNLAGNLLRFRSSKYALIADIERAFLQVALQPCDRDVTRTLWVKDLNRPPTEDNVWVLRHTTVLFGMNCSPFLLAATIIYHAENSELLPEDLKRELLTNTYVDNVMCAADSEEQILNKYRKLKKFFGSMKMNLRCFSSNASWAVQQMDESDKESEKIVKMLGLQWDTIADTIRISPSQLSENATTKAEVSAALGMSFDPLGLMVPILIQAKFFLQEMWEKELDWYREMPVEMQTKWDQIWKQIENNCIIIPRHAASVNPVEPSELLVYTDSSEAAMGCCVYLVQKGRKDLLMGKSKLLSKKIVYTIPKAELSALTMACLLANFVYEQLKGSIKMARVIVYGDNQAVLAWLREPPPYKDGVFVRNRLREISAVVASLSAENIKVRFGYVPTTENIADCCTRGNFKTVWSQEVWIKGPQLIDNENSDRKLIELKDCEGEEGEPDYVQVNAVTQEDSSLLDLSNFSSLDKAIATVATVMRFFKRVVVKWPVGKQKAFLKKHPSFRTAPASKILSIAEWQEAKRRLLIAHQKEQATRVEIGKIRQDKRVEKQADGIYRVISRMHESNLPNQTKDATIIHSHSRLSELIAWQTHSHFHKPIDQTIADIRDEYYIKTVKQLAAGVVRKCVRCKRYNGLPYRYPAMTDLPARRVKEGRPFGHIGLDYFGPLYAKVNGEKQKWYGCVFTCTTTRLVHLEVAPDLSTFSFLNCLKRFVARRGLPSTITSDNAPNFALGEEILGEAMTRWGEAGEIHDFLVHNQCEWLHITPYSPWKGGFYERIVKSIKHSFYKSFGRTVLQLDAFQTAFAEIESILNSRPLTTQLSDELAPLRPIDFLQRHLNISMPLASEGDSEDPDFLPQITSKAQAEEAIRSAEQVVEQYWSIWRENYLKDLRDHHKANWNHRRSTPMSPSVGQVVLLAEPVRPRNAWRLAKITKLIQGKDGAIRDAEVKIGSTGTITNRPVNLLIPFEFVTDTQPTDAKLSEPAKKRKAETQPKQESEKRYELRRAKKIDYRQLHEGSVNCMTTVSGHGFTKLWLTFGICLMLFAPTFGHNTGNNLQPVDTTLKGTARCNNGGIDTLFVGVEEYSICSESFCITSHDPPSHEHIKFPPEIVMFPFKVHVKVGNKVSQKHFDLECPAVDFCLAIDCVTCLDYVFNPSCWPTAALIGYCIIFFLVILGVVALFKLPVKLGTPLVILFQILLKMIKISTTILFTAIRLCIKAKVKVQRKMNLETGDKEERLEREAEEFLLAVQKAKDSKSKKWAWLTAIAVLTLITPGQGCQEINLQGTHNLICRQSSESEKCSVELTEILKLNNYHHTACLIARTNSSKIMEIRLQWSKLDLQCNPSISHYTRDVYTKTTVRGCLEECMGNSSFNPNNDLPYQLHFSTCMPAYCAAVEESVFRKLFWIDHLIRYRNKAESSGQGLERRDMLVWPSSNVVYTVKQCDKWTPTVHLEVTRYQINGKKFTEQISLQPNIPLKLDDISLTLSMLSHPNHKALNYDYITKPNGDTAIWPPEMEKPIITCESFTEAEKFQNCSLVNCMEMTNCQQISLNTPFEHTEWKLPTDIAGSELNENDSSIVLSMTQAVMTEFTVRFHSEIDNTFIKTHDDTCRASDATVFGCYSCAQGGKFNISCTSSKLEVVGELICGKDSFALTCRPGGESTTLIIFRNSSSVNETCHLKCGNERQDIQLTGTLRYLPPRWAAVKQEIWKSELPNSKATDDGTNFTSGIGGWMSNIVLGIFWDLTSPFIEFFVENKSLIIIGFLITMAIAIVAIPIIMSGPAIAVEWGAQFVRIFLKYSIMATLATVRGFIKLSGSLVIYFLRVIGYLRQLRTECQRMKIHEA
jgi:hypothetical protein